MKKTIFFRKPQKVFFYVLKCVFFENNFGYSFLKSFQRQNFWIFKEKWFQRRLSNLNVSKSSIIFCISLWFAYFYIKTFLYCPINHFFFAFWWKQTNLENFSIPPYLAITTEARHTYQHSSPLFSTFDHQRKQTSPAVVSVDLQIQLQPSKKWNTKRHTRPKQP